MDSTSARLADWLRSLPQLTVAAATMYGCGCLLLTGGIIAWEPGRNPRWVLSILAVVALALFVWTVVRGRQFTPAEALVFSAVQLFTVGCMTWTTDLDLGAFANGTVLPIVGVFMIWFLEPTRARGVLHVGTAWWFVAILHRHDASVVPFAAALVVQTLIAAEVFLRIKARMERLARTDPLTGTLNRRGVTEVVDRELQRAVRRKLPLAVVAIDLDGLREINNTLGHRAGEQLLETITRHWLGGIRRGDDVGRTGGDEFLFVLPNTTEAEAETFVRRMAVSSPGAWSAGIAVAQASDSAISLVERADRRMYVQKAERQGAGVPEHGNRPSVEPWTSDPMTDTSDPPESPTRPSRHSGS
jgi:diguanylate cyclase (GGDEF)-like protein